jgi:hypothetical protein
MNDIDRIAQDFAASLADDGWDYAQLHAAARHALLEYGAIVREECAKVCKDKAERAREAADAMSRPYADVSITAAKYLDEAAEAIANKG